MSQAEVNPFSDAEILASLRLKLKGALYKQFKSFNVANLFTGHHPGSPTTTSISYSSGHATLGDLRMVVRQKLKLSCQFVPDPALSKLVAYLSSPLLALDLESERPGSPYNFKGNKTLEVASAILSDHYHAAGGGEQGSSSYNNHNTSHNNNRSSSDRSSSAPVVVLKDSTLNQIRTNPIIGSMLVLPLLPGELPPALNSTISSTSSFSLAELQKFIQHGAPQVSEKAEVDRVMDKKRAERTIRKFQVAIIERFTSQLSSQLVQLVPEIPVKQGQNNVGSLNVGDTTTMVGDISGGGVTANDLKILYIKVAFTNSLRQFTKGRLIITLSELKNYFRKSGFAGFEFGEADCNILYIAIYKFPNLNLLEQCHIAKKLSTANGLEQLVGGFTGGFGIGSGMGGVVGGTTTIGSGMGGVVGATTTIGSGMGGVVGATTTIGSGMGSSGMVVGASNINMMGSTTTTNTGQTMMGQTMMGQTMMSQTMMSQTSMGSMIGGGMMGGHTIMVGGQTSSEGDKDKVESLYGGLLSPRQKRIEKWLYPRSDSQYIFYINDLVSLLDLPKKSGLAIEDPDFRLPNTTVLSTQLLDNVEDNKLQLRYRQWCMSRNKLQHSFNSSSRTCPPRTRFHAGQVQQHQWRLNHTLGY